MAVNFLLDYRFFLLKIPMLSLNKLITNKQVLFLKESQKNIHLIKISVIFL